MLWTPPKRNDLSELLRIAERDQRSLQERCGNPDLRIRPDIVSGVWRVVHKPEGRPVEYVYSEPLVGRPNVPAMAAAVHRNDRSRRGNEDAAEVWLRPNKEVERQRERGIAETHEVVTEGNYEISKAIRKEHIV